MHDFTPDLPTFDLPASDVPEVPQPAARAALPGAEADYDTPLYSASDMNNAQSNGYKLGLDHGRAAAAPAEVPAHEEAPAWPEWIRILRRPMYSKFAVGDVEKAYRWTHEGACVILANDCEWYVDSWEPATPPDQACGCGHPEEAHSGPCMSCGCDNFDPTPAATPPDVGAPEADDFTAWCVAVQDDFEATTKVIRDWINHRSVSTLRLARSLAFAARWAGEAADGEDPGAGPEMVAVMLPRWIVESKAKTKPDYYPPKSMGAEMRAACAAALRGQPEAGR